MLDIVYWYIDIMLDIPIDIMLDFPIDIMLDIPSLRIYTCVDLSQYAHTHTCMYRYIYIDKQVYSYMHVTSHTAPSLMHVYV